MARQLYERADGLACGHAMPDVIGSQQTQHRQQMLTQVAAGNGGLGQSAIPREGVSRPPIGNTGGLQPSPEEDRDGPELRGQEEQDEPDEGQPRRKEAEWMPPR